MPVCQCEHFSHGANEDPDTGLEVAPVNHPDNTEVSEADLIQVATIYGKYMICKTCNEQHPIPDEMIDPPVLRLSGNMKQIDLDDEGKATYDEPDADDNCTGSYP